MLKVKVTYKIVKAPFFFSNSYIFLIKGRIRGDSNYTGRWSPPN